jgi:MFS family permease
MRGISADSAWTHLIAGFIIAGAGTGLVNAPLASTAIGVVAPQDAGMASGINSTFRQVGIAVAIAALGSIFSTKLAHATPATLGVHYASAMNSVLLIGGITAIVAAVLTVPLIRQRDFLPHGGPQSDAQTPALAETAT